MMKELVIKFLKSTKFQTFAWNTFNWFMSIIIAYVADLDYTITPVIFAWLNLLTKELNKNFNPYYKHDEKK